MPKLQSERLLIFDIALSQVNPNLKLNFEIYLRVSNLLIGTITITTLNELKLSFGEQFNNDDFIAETLKLVCDYLFNQEDYSHLEVFNIIDSITTKYKTITKDKFNSVSVRKALEFEVNLVNDIYDSIVNYLENTTNFCGWKHGIYPTLEVAQKAFSKGELFVAVQSGKVIGSCIINHEQAVQYFDIDWKIKDDKPLVVHTVAINPNNLRQGVAHTLLEFAKDYAKEHNVLTIRLDASEPNYPARKIYEDVGFIKRGEMDLLTNRCGINNWFAYEFIIKKEK